MKNRSHDPLSDLLAGNSSAGRERDEVAEFLASAKRALTRDPDPTTTLTHLGDIRIAVAEAKVLQSSKVSGPMTNWRTVTAGAAALVVGTVAMFGGTAGLAYAGMNLPGTAAEKAVERVLGLTLPNQETEDAESDGEGSENEVTSGGKSSSDAVHQVKENTELQGCEFGQAVAAAARGNSEDENAGRDHPCKENETGEATDKPKKEKPDKDTNKPDKDTSKGDKEKSNNGKSDEAPGKSEAPGQADTTETVTGKDRGKSGEDHGKPDKVESPDTNAQDPVEDPVEVEDPTEDPVEVEDPADEEQGNGNGKGPKDK